MWQHQATDQSVSLPMYNHSSQFHTLAASQVSELVSPYNEYRGETHTHTYTHTHTHTRTHTHTLSQICIAYLQKLQFSIYSNILGFVSFRLILFFPT